MPNVVLVLVSAACDHFPSIASDGFGPAAESDGSNDNDLATVDVQAHVFRDRHLDAPPPTMISFCCHRWCYRRHRSRHAQSRTTAMAC